MALLRGYNLGTGLMRRPDDTMRTYEAGFFQGVAVILFLQGAAMLFAAPDLTIARHFNQIGIFGVGIMLLSVILGWWSSRLANATRTKAQEPNDRILHLFSRVEKDLHEILELTGKKETSEASRPG